MGYYKFDVKDSEKTHRFMAEELLVPRMQNSDTQRINMFASHTAQIVTLQNPEFPKVFTGYENQVGKYSSGYKKAEEDFIIISKIVKNEFNYDLIVQYKKSKKYDIIHYRCYDHISETYGSSFVEREGLRGKKVGDSVKKGEILYATPSYDSDMNFCYGVNLKATYLSWKGLTYEDPIVISESAAKKLTSFKVDQVYVSVNGNNVLLNLYGNSEENQSLPKIGEHTLGNILCASREKSNKTVLYNFQFDKMCNVQTGDNITFCTGGKVVDIDIYSNKTPDQLRESNKDAYMQTIADMLEEQDKYYKKLAEELDKIIPVATDRDLQSVMSETEKQAYRQERSKYVFDRPLPKSLNPNDYTDELGYAWKKVHEYLNDRIRWRHDGSAFNTIRMKYTILKENPLTPGCKLSGRYGNKGVVSLIESDDRMPTTEDGMKAEVILNPYGVINRMNVSQLYEQKINFMSDHVAKIIKSKTNRLDKEKELFNYLLAINRREFDYMFDHYANMSDKDKDAFMKDIEENGIYIHQYPFWDNINDKDFIKINKQHPEWSTKYKCKGIEKPITIGDIYFERLKHESSNKSSVRSTDSLNQKGLPLKTNVIKEHSKLIANTPIRIGEMEVANLLICQDPELVNQFMQQYATNKQGREELITTLLTANNPLNITVNYTDDKTITRRILDQYLKVLELEIE